MAVRTRQQMAAEIQDRLADNSSREISEAAMRSVAQDLSDSSATAAELAAETAARTAADTALGQRIDGLPAPGSGDAGDSGWSPIFAVAADAARRVLRLVGWVGGSGNRPAITDSYLGSDGLKATAAEATDIRGPAGPAGGGDGPGTGTGLSSAEVLDLIADSLTDSAFSPDAAFPVAANGNLPAQQDNTTRTAVLTAALGSLTSAQVALLDNVADKALAADVHIDFAARGLFEPTYRLQLLNGSDIVGSVNPETAAEPQRFHFPLQIGQYSQALSLRLTATWRIALPASFSLRVDSAVITERGVIYDDVASLADERVSRVTGPLADRLDKVDRSLQDQIDFVARNVLRGDDRARLDLLEILESTVFAPYAVSARTGSTGDYGAKATTFDPVGPTVQVSIPAAEAIQVIDSLVARQANDAGVPQDYRLAPFASADNVFFYRVTVPNTNQISFLRIEDVKALRLVEDLAGLARRMDAVTGYLGPDAVALLRGVSRGVEETTDRSRTALLPHLTLAPGAIAAGSGNAPRASEALSGREYLVAAAAPRPTAPDAGAAAADVVEMFLSDGARQALIRSAPGPNGFMELEAAYLRAARPAQPVKSRVYLHLDRLDPGGAIDEYEIAVHPNPGSAPQHWAGRFAVPSAAGAITVHVQYFANGNLVDTRDFAASAALQSRYGPQEPWSRYQTLVQRVGDEIFLEFRPTGVAVTARMTARASAYYTATSSTAAVPERIEYAPIFGGISTDSLIALFAVKVVDGSIVLVMEDHSSAGGLVSGETNTGIPASRFGLQAGGTGVLRFHQALYSQLVRVTAGDVTPADMAMLRAHATQREKWIGLFADTDAEDRTFIFDRAIKAPGLYVGETHVGDALFAPSVALRADADSVSIPAWASDATEPLGYTAPAGAAAALIYVATDAKPARFVAGGTFTGAGLGPGERAVSINYTLGMGRAVYGEPAGSDGVIVDYVAADRKLRLWGMGARAAHLWGLVWQ